MMKGLYILRCDAPGKEKRPAENYLTIAGTAEGYYVYNEFGKPGVVVKRYGTAVCSVVERGKPQLLKNGDEIYFEPDGGHGTEIECGGARYSFIRMARFMEVRQ